MNNPGIFNLGDLTITAADTQDSEWTDKLDGMTAVTLQARFAYGSGGVLETVRGILPNEAALENPTGVFFTEQSLSGLTRAMLEFESIEPQFHPEIIREHSLQFGSGIFKQRISEFIAFAVTDFRERNQADDSCASKAFDALAGA